MTSVYCYWPLTPASDLWLLLLTSVCCGWPLTCYWPLILLLTSDSCYWPLTLASDLWLLLVISDSCYWPLTPATDLWLLTSDLCYWLLLLTSCVVLLTSDSCYWPLTPVPASRPPSVGPPSLAPAFPVPCSVLFELTETVQKYRTILNILLWMKVWKWKSVSIGNAMKWHSCCQVAFHLSQLNVIKIIDSHFSHCCNIISVRFCFLHRGTYT